MAPAASSAGPGAIATAPAASPGGKATPTPPLAPHGAGHFSYEGDGDYSAVHAGTVTVRDAPPAMAAPEQDPAAPAGGKDKGKAHGKGKEMDKGKGKGKGKDKGKEKGKDKDKGKETGRSRSPGGYPWSYGGTRYGY